MKKSYKRSKSISHLDVEHGRISYRVNFRNVKYPRLEINGASLSLILPKDRKDHKKIINNKRTWIIKKYKHTNKILEANKRLNENLIVFGRPVKVINSESKIKFLNGKIYIDTKDLSKLRSFLKNVLKEKLVKLTQKYSKLLNVDYNRIYIRQQKTKWASCSSRRNLTFNLRLISLPNELINYVVFHEMAHLIEKNHSQNFISIIRKTFPNYQEMEEELKKYWIVLNNNHWWNLIK